MLLREADEPTAESTIFGAGFPPPRCGILRYPLYDQITLTRMHSLTEEVSLLALACLSFFFLFTFFFFLVGVWLKVSV